MKQSRSIFKMKSAAACILLSGIFLFSCNTNPGSTNDNAPDTISASPLPTTADTAGIAVNTMKDSTAMSSDTSMNKKAVTGTKTKKTGSVSVKMASDNSAKMEMDKSGIYGRAEVMPMFPGGENALDKYISSHIQYPETAADNGTEGTVTVQFAVDEHGKVYEPKETGAKVGDGLDEEALKVVAGMPQWTPGQIKGKNVKTYYTLPVVFTLQ